MPYEATFKDAWGGVVKVTTLSDGVRNFDVTPPHVPEGSVFFHREGYEGRNDVGYLVPGGDPLYRGSLSFVALSEASPTRKILGVRVEGDFNVEMDSGNGDINGRVEIRFKGDRKI